MDVCRLSEPITADGGTADTSTAVAQIHKTMVMLRQEIVRKNQTIKRLEKDLMGKQTRTGLTQRHEEDPNRILSYAEDMDSRCNEEDGESSPTLSVSTPNATSGLRNSASDLVVPFVAEDEDDETVVNQNDPPSSTITLVANEDIVIHQPPAISSPSVLRPILRSSQQKSRSSSGSQTDITALHDIPRPWRSEPHLSVSTLSPCSSHSHFRSHSVAFDEPRKPKSSELTVMTLPAKMTNFISHEEFHLPHQHLGHSSSDLDKLLLEADFFVTLAKSKLVTMEDWRCFRTEHKI